MNNTELLEKLKLTEDALKHIKDELMETKERLKKYTAPARSKMYYDNHIARLSNIHGVIRCKHNECKLCYMDRDINASKNILGLLLNQYRGEERPTCFKPKKIGVIPRKSYKRSKACDSPLHPC